MSTYIWRLVEAILTCDTDGDFKLGQILYWFPFRPFHVMLDRPIATQSVFLNYIVSSFQVRVQASPSVSVDIDPIVASASELKSIVLSSVILSVIAISPSYFLTCFWRERGYKKRLPPHGQRNNPSAARVT